MTILGTDVLGAPKFVRPMAAPITPALIGLPLPFGFASTAAAPADAEVVDADGRDARAFEASRADACAIVSVDADGRAARAFAASRAFDDDGVAVRRVLALGVAGRIDIRCGSVPSPRRPCPTVFARTLPRAPIPRYDGRAGASTGVLQHRLAYV